MSEAEELTRIDRFFTTVFAADGPTLRTWSWSPKRPTQKVL
jgi:hypothetical protein